MNDQAGDTVRTGRLGWARILPPLVAAIAALLPLLPALLAGESLYFRDIGRYYYPLRRFVVEGLRHGELRYWNPFCHEGVQELFPPVSYPFDLLQLLVEDEAGFTLLLALHLPLAALGLFALARALGLGSVSSAGGAAAYALGGLALSSLNLYEQAQTVAWAPIVCVTTLRAAARGGWWITAAALASATMLSVGRIDLAAQGIAVATLLAMSAEGARWGRLAVAIGSGGLLAAPTWLAMRATIEGSARGAGLSVETVVGRSLHPLSLLQTIIADFHGDLGNLVVRFWGDSYFEAGSFPYYLSLYLGPILIALAVTGAGSQSRWRRPLLVLGTLALVISLGRWVVPSRVVGAIPAPIRLVRYPVKAFFTVHLVVCLMAAAGLDRLLAEDGARRRRAFSIGLGLVGSVLVATLALPLLPDSRLAGLLDTVAPPGASRELRHAVLVWITRSAALGGACAVVAAAVAAARRRIGPAPAVALIAGLAAADLLRAGAGLNPSVPVSFFDPSPEMAPVLAQMRSAGGRVFSCYPQQSRAWQAALPVRFDTFDVWLVAASRDTLVPYHNVRAGLPSALSQDLTDLVPLERVATPGLTSCARIGQSVRELRRAGVAHVVSVDPIASPDLQLRAEVHPRAIVPFAVRVYSLREPWPLRFVAREVTSPGSEGHEGPFTTSVPGIPPVSGARGEVRAIREGTQWLRLWVESDRPTVVVVRDGWAEGWTARVNGQEAPVLRADGRHRAVPIGAGRSDVLLVYAPPGARAGLALAALGALVAGACATGASGFTARRVLAALRRGARR
jgi:hypothetical protein